MVLPRGWPSHCLGVAIFLTERGLTNVMQSAKVLAFPPMNLIKLLLLAALVATVIVLFAEGPDLLTIIDQH